MIIVYLLCIQAFIKVFKDVTPPVGRYREYFCHHTAPLQLYGLMTPKGGIHFLVSVYV